MPCPCVSNIKQLCGESRRWTYCTIIQNDVTYNSFILYSNCMKWVRWVFISMMSRRIPSPTHIYMDNSRSVSWRDKSNDKDNVELANIELLESKANLMGGDAYLAWTSIEITCPKIKDNGQETLMCSNFWLIRGSLETMWCVWCEL